MHYEIIPDTHSIEDWVGPRAGLCVLKTEELLWPGIEPRFLGFSTFGQVTTPYTLFRPVM
jgi:hypothetical protein